MPYTWNYRITVEVETPDGIKTGSTVRQLQMQEIVQLNPDRGNAQFRVKGEAIVIDLGKYGALVEIPDYQEFLDAFPVEHANRIKYYNSLPNGKVSHLNTGNYPLINFQNIDDPDSIRTVNSDQFEQSFDKEVNLKKITILTTEDEVTYGQVRKHFSWFGKKHLGVNQANRNEKDHAKFLTNSDFIKGE